MGCFFNDIRLINANHYMGTLNNRNAFTKLNIIIRELNTQILINSKGYYK